MRWPRQRCEDLAGKDVDQAVEKAEQQVEKAGESIQDAAKGDTKK